MELEHAEQTAGGGRIPNISQITSFLAEADAATIALGAILLVWTIYAFVFVFSTSAVIGDVRYFMLFDDDMVSMRYASNLVRGYGLVFNPHGPAVEGFSSPLWVMIFAILHLLPLSSAKMSLVVQLLTIGLRLATMLIVWRLALRLTRDSKMVALCAVIFTAFYYPLNSWSLRGSEVALLAPMLALAVYFAIDVIEGAAPWRFWILLAVSTLASLQMIIPAAIVLGFVAWLDAPRRREHLLTGGGVLVGTIAAQILLAWWYFGYPLPNGYYLNMTGYPASLRFARGWHMTMLFLGSLEPVALALVAVMLWLRRDAILAMLAALFVAQVAYNFYVGGDAWEFGGANRDLCVVMPLFMILLAMALQTTAQGLTALLTPEGSEHATAAFVVLAIVSALVIATFGPFPIGAKSALRQLALLDPPPAQDDQIDHLRLAVVCTKISEPEATIAVVYPGVLPYLCDRVSYDFFGHTDAHIAHEQMRVGPNIEFLPGRLKWDHKYTYEDLAPDAIAEQLRLNGETHAPPRPAYYHWWMDDHRWYIRGSSGHIKGDMTKLLRDKFR